MAATPTSAAVTPRGYAVRLFLWFLLGSGGVVLEVWGGLTDNVPVFVVGLVAVSSAIFMLGTGRFIPRAPTVEQHR